MVPYGLEALGTLVEPKAPVAEEADGELLEDAAEATGTAAAHEEAKPKRTRTQLLKEAIDLGIDVPPKATADEIEGLIKKQFA